MAKVKICGLRTLADVELVNRYQPEYAGFVFASTRRFVTDEQALLMRKKLADSIQAVGVFVDHMLTETLKKRRWKKSKSQRDQGLLTVSLSSIRSYIQKVSTA